MNNFLVTFPKICIYFILYILISESQYLDDLSIEDYVCPDVSIRLGDYLPGFSMIVISIIIVANYFFINIYIVCLSLQSSVGRLSFRGRSKIC